MQKKFAILLAGTTTIALSMAGMAPANANGKFGTSWDSYCAAGNTPQACSLQSLMNHHTASGPQMDVNQDTGYELFTNTGDNVTGSFLFSIAGYAPDNTFGLYKAGDPNSKIQLFGGGTSTGTESMVSFLNNGAVKVGNQIVQNFGRDFGFYLSGPGGTFFSQKALNGGNQQTMIYQGNGQTVLNIGGKNTLFGLDTFLVGFEDLPLWAGDKDYNDMVLLVSGVKGKQDVPEPGLMLGMAGIASAAVMARRRKQA